MNVTNGYKKLGILLLQLWIEKIFWCIVVTGFSWISQINQFISELDRRFLVNCVLYPFFISCSNSLKRRINTPFCIIYLMTTLAPFILRRSTILWSPWFLILRYPWLPVAMICALYKYLYLIYVRQRKLLRF